MAEYEKLQKIQLDREILELEKQKRKSAALERLQQMDLQRLHVHQKWREEQRMNHQLKHSVPLFKKLEHQFEVAEKEKQMQI